MSIVKSVGDFFRTAKTEGPVKLDRYDIITPLMNVQEYVARTQDLLKLIVTDTSVMDVLHKRTEAKVHFIEKGYKAHLDYIKGLPSSLKGTEEKSPFSTMISALSTIDENLTQVETHFPALFGDTVGTITEEDLRSSSLVVIGYIETVSEFCTWIGILIKLLTATNNHLIPPFEMKSLQLKAEKFGDFVGFNSEHWAGKGHGIVESIKIMQKKGTDVSLRSGESWIDSFIHDNLFSDHEKNMMAAGLRSPVLMVSTKVVQIKGWWINFLAASRDWLIAKTALESERLKGLDPESQDYKKLETIVEKYANLASKYEQKLERARS